MKRILLTCLIPLFSFHALAEDVFLKDGKVIRAQGLRREGNFLFVRTTNADGVGSEALHQINQVDRIGFAEPAALVEARQLANAGKVEAVLEKTAPLMAQARLFADIPGNIWADLVRLRLPALVVSENKESLADLQKQWAPTGDSDLENAFKIVFSGQSGADPKALLETFKSQAIPGTPSLTAGLAWLELGKAALENKQWKDAIRAFLSVEVFVPNYRLLHPQALLGATRAFVSSGELKEAKIRIEVLQAEFPDCPELKKAAELMPLPPPPVPKNK